MKVVTFGELMLRLQPFNYLRFVQSDNYEATFGGGEANVAVSLANYGEDAYFVSKIPSNEIGQAGINSLRKFGVNTKFVTRDPKVKLSMIEHTPAFISRNQKIMIGTLSLMALIGSISLVSLLLLANL